MYDGWQKVDGLYADVDGGWCGQPMTWYGVVWMVDGVDSSQPESACQPTSLPAFDLPPWVVRRGYGVDGERGTMA